MSAVAHINRIGTAVPPHDVHGAFVRFASRQLTDERRRRLFERMVARCGIERRFSFLRPVEGPDGQITDAEDFYRTDAWPGTAARMERYEADAPVLALQALDALDLQSERSLITHLVVASCTGFVAPGLDQLIVARAGLNPSVERTVVGFMGCYAAVNSLRLAHHIVRSEPDARVLVVTLELCTLHLQPSQDVDQVLSMLLFGDGCAAALVSADAQGLALLDFRAAAIADSARDITWRIGDQGFDMHLSGAVPGKIARALAAVREAAAPDGLLRGAPPEDYGLWAVHAGGRTILDAVETAFQLAPAALEHSRAILREFGNMSSATLMFVLQRILKGANGRRDDNRAGLAVAFGPGLAAESFRFRIAG
ncbi:MAG TPA: type III polyketide synthase [Caulobacteraceae bacterium]|jgi:predicted naringenin-chalcone synthase|nr:type III polyketide synthase [Caulobacteraceae bacterium]